MRPALCANTLDHHTSTTAAVLSLKDLLAKFPEFVGALRTKIWVALHTLAAEYPVAFVADRVTVQHVRLSAALTVNHSIPPWILAVR